jgi:hypothetical protein
MPVFSPPAIIFYSEDPEQHSVLDSFKHFMKSATNFVWHNVDSVITFGTPKIFGSAASKCAELREDYETLYNAYNAHGIEMRNIYYKLEEAKYNYHQCSLGTGGCFELKASLESLQNEYNVKHDALRSEFYSDLDSVRKIGIKEKILNCPAYNAPEFKPPDSFLIDPYTGIKYQSELHRH